MAKRSRPIRVLLVEDNPGDAALANEHLADSVYDFQIIHEATLAGAVEQLGQGQVDIVLLDLALPDSQGLDTFHQLAEVSHETPVVILSGQEDEEFATEAVRVGAQDYLLKGKIDSSSLTRAIRYAVERTRRQRMEKELRTAAEIQKRLLPQPSTQIFGFDIAGRCVPAAYVGGDLFDFFPMSNGHLGVVIADAAGHGMGPAMMMTETRAVIRTLAAMASDAGEILTRASYILSKDLDQQMFVSLFLACLDPASRCFRFASAGHHASLLDASGREKRRLNTGAPPLGITSKHLYQSSGAISLKAEESLFLFTDGITECENAAGARYGIYRLLESLSKNYEGDASHVLTQLFDRIAAFRGTARRQDDMSAVLVKVQATPSTPLAQSRTVPLAGASTLPTQFRHFDMSERKDFAVVVLNDKEVLTTVACNSLQAELMSLIDEANPRHMVVSFEHVTKFSSVAINVFLRLRTALDKKNKRVVLCHMGTVLREAFRALNLEDSVFKIVDNVDKAANVLRDT